MEDISRELEREIDTNLRPTPFKRTQTKRVIIVDDFGEMTSGEWIRKAFRFFLFLSIITSAAAAVFCYLYLNIKDGNSQAIERITTMEKRIKRLVDEKEVLMARLVILQKGKDAEGLVITAVEQPVTPQKDDEAVAQTDQEKKIPKTEPASEELAERQSKAESKDVEAEETTPDVKPAAQPSSDIGHTAPVFEKTVNIEKFKVFKDTENQDLLVRFDIRNVSGKPGDVAGYIFTVLRPDAENTDDWLVVPTTTLKKGIPDVFKKGQYFSIAHYKPVKFRIKNQSKPDFFTKASIFVFSTKGDLIFEKLIDITESE